MENELTYEEHKLAKLKEEYVEKTTMLLRNITLRNVDIKDDIITEEFFTRADVSDIVKDKIKKLNTTIKK